MERANAVFLPISCLAFPGDDLEHSHGFAFAFHGHAIETSQDKASAYRAGCNLTDQDAAAIDLVGSFEARRQIHRIADNRVVESGCRTHVPHDRVTGVDADSGTDRGQIILPNNDLSIESVERVQAVKGCLNGITSVASVIERCA